MAAVERAPRLSRQYVKLCDLRDFDDPALRERIREIVPGRAPEAELHRKFWEYAMLALFLEDVGKLEDSAELLAVGAGHETVLFWLANRVGRVVATDIYGEGAFSGNEADATMLSNPAAFAPYPYREDRLDVRHMDARALDFPDASFDAVFSLSSIEHFGTPADIAQASREIGRVLRPGGYAFVATECFVSSHPLDWPAVQVAIRVVSLGRLARNATLTRRAVEVFTPRELRSRIVEPSGLELVQPMDLTLSQESRGNVIRAIGGRFEPATGREWPHVLLQAHGAPWTSIALAMRKSD